MIHVCIEKVHQTSTLLYSSKHIASIREQHFRLTERRGETEKIVTIQIVADLTKEQQKDGKLLTDNVRELRMADVNNVRIIKRCCKGIDT